MTDRSSFSLTNDALYRPVGAMPNDDVIARAARVRLLILDVDGVLTTGYLGCNCCVNRVSCWQSSADVIQKSRRHGRQI